MASNKFSQSPVTKQKPAICIAPPIAPFPPVPFSKPRDLSGFIRWLDLDPALKPVVNFSSYLTLAKVDDVPTYKGTTPSNTWHATAIIHLETSPNIWHLELQLFKKGTYIESHHWPDLTIAGPFDTGILYDVNIPGKDYRLTRFME